MIHAFTSCAPNYAGKARVLFESLRRHCREITVHWLVTDRRRPGPEEWVAGVVDRVWYIDDLAPGRDAGWRFGHDLVELATAAKPLLAQVLLQLEATDLVVYFDPDVAVFSPLDDLLEAALEAPATLTPHLLRAETDSKPIIDHELCMLRNGIYNLGFVAVRRCGEGRAFLDWWAERCRLLCTSDSSSGAFTDQKWIDLAPVFFPAIRIERGSRFNVAPWNINQRRLSGTFDAGFAVDGAPLGFYHFTGFDSGAHQQVVDHYAKGNASVQMLLDWYGFRSRALLPRRADVTWSLGRYSDGWNVLPEHRRIYRARRDLQRAFPDPLDATTSPSYPDWLRGEGRFGSPTWSRAAAGSPG